MKISKNVILLILYPLVFSFLLSCDGDSNLSEETLSIEKTQLMSPDREPGALFGYSVAIDGDYAVVGEPGENTAYVFFNNDTGSWDNVAKLVPSDESLQFGYAVTIHGDLIAIGDPGENYELNQNGSSGAVYIFKRTDGNAWELETVIPSPDATKETFSGLSLLLDNTSLLVGAPQNMYDDLIHFGIVYIFEENESGDWELDQQIDGPINGLLDENQFGTSIAKDNNFLIVGAPGIVAHYNYGGHLFVFDIDQENPWESCFQSESHHGYEQLATSVAINSTHVIIGSPGNALVYLFERQAQSTTLIELRRLEVPSGPYSGGFCQSVASSDDYILIGGDSSAGKVLLFDSASEMIWDNRIEVLQQTQDSGFGCAIAVSGDYAIVGASQEDSQSGAAYIVRISREAI